MGRILRRWPTKAYGTILADPPWPLRGGKGGKAGYSKTMSADAQYPLMTVRQIAELPVGQLALPDSHLFLWVPNGFLFKARDVVEAWGFRYVTNECWYKDDSTVGIGQYLRNKHELCLLCIRGRPPYAVDNATGKRVTVDSAFTAARGRHSAKPCKLHWIAEQLGSGALGQTRIGPRLELFARSRRKGWDAWGNQL